MPEATMSSQQALAVMEIPHATSSHSENNESVMSSETQQTRFSFYNAQEFAAISTTSNASNQAIVKSNSCLSESSSPSYLHSSSQLKQAQSVAVTTHFLATNIVSSPRDCFKPPMTPAGINGNQTKTQKQSQRFNFYNSEDLDTTKKQGAAEKQEKSSPLAVDVKAGDSSSSKGKSHAPAERKNNHTSATLDSSEILRSLQEHEQQRMEILNGAAFSSSTQQATIRNTHARSSSAVGRNCPAASSTTNGRTIQYSAVGAGNQSVRAASVGPAVAAANVSSSAPASNDENPYEEAIKEALQLLRKHRNNSAGRALSSKTQLQQQQPIHSKNRTQPPPPVQVSAVDETMLVDNTTASRRDVEPLKQQFVLESLKTPSTEDQVLLSRRSATASSAAPYWNYGNHHKANNSMANASLDETAVTPSNNQFIDGEVLHPAEMEARRKLRQEKMAKYASRLAELKQEDLSVPDVRTHPSEETEEDDAGDAGFVNFSARQQPPVPCSDNRAWTQDPTTSWRTQDHFDFPPNRVTSPGRVTTLEIPGQPLREEGHSLTGSMSTLSNKDDDVQRGVERVLLAILERANSRGRSLNSGANGVVSNSQSWQRGEEKKSNSEELSPEEDALVQAMSDLLISSSRGSSSNSGISSSLQQRDPVPSFDHVSSNNDPDDDEDNLAVFHSAHSMHSAHSNQDWVTASRSGDECGRLEMIDDAPHSQGCSAVMEGVASASNAATVPQHLLGLHSLAPGLLAAKDDLVATGSGIEAVHSDPGTTSNSLRVEIPEHESAHLDGGASWPPPGRIHRIAPTSSSVRKDVSGGLKFQDGDISESDREPHSLATPSNYTQSSAETDDEEFPERSEDDTEGLGTGAEETDGGEESFEESEEESEGDDERILNGVLGRLSGKGKTGVVLEATSPRRAQDTTKSPSLLESLSAAVMLVTGSTSTASGEEIVKVRQQQQMLQQILSSSTDKYSTGYGAETEEEDEASELMRTLCAHLLPFGVDRRSSRLLDKLPEWDESNPDEAGYRIIRLTSYQLRGVEEAFERMVVGLRRNSEQNLTVLGTDAAFERDLQTAEELLDRAERLQGSSSDTAEKTMIEALERMNRNLAEDANTSTDTAEEDLPGFPGIKPAGKGEMGDLEFFCLPIIFKSNVTGFEPTKDLYLEPGNIVAGQYLVEGELGSAAFSTAYRCIDLSSDCGDGEHDEVCLKVIKNTKDFFDQSLDEIKILELLRQTGKCHEKFIIEMKTFFYHREHLIIVTELLRQNLFEFGKFIIDNNEEPYFTIPRLAYITRQVLVALDFVHSIGLVHSDVKPENILLGSYSRAHVKLIDFGSSCYLTDRQSSYIQSRSYRAPEVILGLPYDGRIDIWSLGCVVAEMFTGEVTFQNDSIVSMLSRIEAICGPFPRHMIGQGRQSDRFFTKCGLLYEKVPLEGEGRKEESDEETEHSEDDDSTGLRRKYVDIFQPKITTLSARLGFYPDLLERYDNDSKLSKKETDSAIFADFVRKLLAIDPDSRPTAAQALEHPWMQYAASLTEEDIKYPPE